MQFECLIVCVILALQSHQTSSLHLVGQWNTMDFYKFLVKFGFQKTDNNDETTQGYIYGNVTVEGVEVNTEVSLVVLDSEYLLKFLNNRLVTPKTTACSRMFSEINHLIWDKNCNIDGKEDFVRYIPCKRGQLCRDEQADRVVKGSQFSFKVRDNIQPRYWYVSLVACTLKEVNGSCEWRFEQPRMNIHYDLWFVNGDPSQSHSNILEHQFSIEQFDLFEMHLAFLILHIFLLPVQLYALHLHKHPVALLLLACMLLELLALACNLAHFSKFSGDGVGCERCQHVGKFLDLLAQSCFMLLLLLVVKGLSITCSTLSYPTTLVVLIIWLAYTTANVVLFFWNLTAVQFISDIGEWQTLPGFLILSFRICIMLWFLWELRATILHDHGLLRSTFYLHFGAGFLTWFIYLPLVVLVCSLLSPFYRYKTILGVCCSVNFFSFIVFTHLLWPTSKHLHFNYSPSPQHSLVSNPQSKGYHKNSLYHHDDNDDDDYDF